MKLEDKILGLYTPITEQHTKIANAKKAVETATLGLNKAEASYAKANEDLTVYTAQARSNLYTLLCKETEKLWQRHNSPQIYKPIQAQEDAATIDFYASAPPHLQLILDPEYKAAIARRDQRQHSATALVVTQNQGGHSSLYLNVAPANHQEGFLVDFVGSVSTILADGYVSGDISVAQQQENTEYTQVQFTGNHRAIVAMLKKQAPKLPQDIDYLVVNLGEDAYEPGFSNPETTWINKKAFTAVAGCKIAGDLYYDVYRENKVAHRTIGNHEEYNLRDLLNILRTNRKVELVSEHDVAHWMNTLLPKDHSNSMPEVVEQLLHEHQYDGLIDAAGVRYLSTIARDRMAKPFIAEATVNHLLGLGHKTVSKDDVANMLGIPSSNVSNLVQRQALEINASGEISLSSVLEHFLPNHYVRSDGKWFKHRKK